MKWKLQANYPARIATNCSKKEQLIRECSLNRVILSAAKNLAFLKLEILRCAQNDKNFYVH